VVDLRDGSLRAHNPDLLLTKVTMATIGRTPATKTGTPR
jgi:hypothetical protein